MEMVLLLFGQMENYCDELFIAYQLGLTGDDERKEVVSRLSKLVERRIE